MTTLIYLVLGCFWIQLGMISYMIGRSIEGPAPHLFIKIITLICGPAIGIIMIFVDKKD